MIFTAAKKAELLAFIETLDPGEDTAPLIAQIAALTERKNELEAVVSAQIQQLIDLNEKIANARAALA